ncbi:MAG TPA: hypothetical protein GXZ69_03845 [Spirochaetales bacterium]|nr:hypothetical protein [Spirochaetales bacterium]
MIEKQFGGTGKIIVQGHRGALGHVPENTLPSFEAGYKMGADVLELDVHLSADNQLVVMHDPEVSRTTNGTGRIKDMTVKQIKELDAGIHFSEKYANTRVPLLSEVLEWAKDKIPLIIEIKGDPFPAPGIEKMVVDEVTKFDMLDKVLVISFYHESVKKIKEYSSILTGILYTGRPIDPVQMTRQANADSFRCYWKYLHADDIKMAHEAGMWVSCWGADTEEDFAQVAEIGIDSIGCNYPDRLRKWLDERNLGIR